MFVVWTNLLSSPLTWVQYSSITYSKTKDDQEVPYWQRSEAVKNTANSSTQFSSLTREFPSLLGDGCYHVFLDVGSHKGVHGRLLFEPEKYPDSTLLSKFDAMFGTNRTLQNICVFAFEPNPLHRTKQLKTQEIYQRMGWRYHYLPVAVSDRDADSVTFYRNYDHDNGAAQAEWGFSATLRDQDENDGAVDADNPSATTRKYGDRNRTDANAVRVQTIDLAAWTERHIFRRDIPPPNYFNILRSASTTSTGSSNLMSTTTHASIPEMDGDMPPPQFRPQPPAVAMKMDIEGMEYAVLQHMLQPPKRTICKFAYLFGEYHSVAAPPSTNSSPRLDAPYFVQRFRRRLNRELQSNGCGVAGFMEWEDERYLMDGMPYPGSRS